MPLTKKQCKGHLATLSNMQLFFEKLAIFSNLLLYFQNKMAYSREGGPLFTK